MVAHINRLGGMLSYGFCYLSLPFVFRCKPSQLRIRCCTKRHSGTARFRCPCPQKTGHVSTDIASFRRVGRLQIDRIIARSSLRKQATSVTSTYGEILYSTSLTKHRVNRFLLCRWIKMAIASPLLVRLVTDKVVDDPLVNTATSER